MNNKAQFTPGPWEHKGNRVYRKDSYEVAWIAGQGPHSEWQANGKLIAAAPAMYEALAKLRLEAIHYRNTGVGVQFLNHAIDQAELAINQVWGEGDHDTKRES